ncbi:MAG TPA: transporter substrate-binding domain-containing protein [Fastidiosipila sp.]|nr:transporter substrate-binding domain-containing protein [Fastidiosipila sp.]
MRKSLILLIVLVIALALSACTPQTPAKTTAGTDAPATDAPATDPPTTGMPETAEAFLAQDGIKVAVQAGTIGDLIAQDMLGADNVDQYHLYVDAITAVKQNKVQGAIMDLGPAEKFLQANPDLMIYDDELTEENYAFGIKKDNKELLDAVNEALAELSASGELKRIFDKYVNDEPGAGDDIDLNKGASGKLIMGTESGFPPYEMRKGDTVVGIDIEIMAAVAKAIDKELVIEDMQFDSLIPAVQSGKIDIIAAGLTVNEERKKEIDFSDDYVIGAKQVLVVKRGD